MKMLLKPIAAVGLALAVVGPVAVSPATAQVVKGVGVVDIDNIIASTQAYKTAEEQRKTTYQQNFDQVKAIQANLRAQTGPLYQKLEADRAAPNADQAAIRAQIEAISRIEQQAQRDISRAVSPVADSQEYVDEQINKVLGTAIETAAKAKNITLLLRVDTGAIVYSDQAYNLNADVVAAVNQALPFANLTPPPNWVPREVREQYSRAMMTQQALYGAEQAPAPTTTGEAAPATGATVPAPAPAGVSSESR